MFVLLSIDLIFLDAMFPSPWRLLLYISIVDGKGKGDFETKEGYFKLKK